MSNPIKHVDVIAIREPLSITREAYEALAKEIPEDETPECSVLDKTWVKYCSIEKDGVIYPRDLWWCHTSSDYTISTFINKVLPKFEGSADIVVVYDSGYFEGYRLDNHVVTKHEVKFSLKT
jgi:hypothetical protein